MAMVDLVMPKMGESIMEATILKWLKKPGDTIAQDESVLEVATDKVDTEVPSMYAGVLKEILAKAGEVVPVGSPIARIEQTNGKATAHTTVEAKPAQAETKPIAETKKEEKKSSDRFYSPLVKTIAKQENISTDELDKITGSGANARVTKQDVLHYIESRKTSSTPVSKPVPVSISAHDEIIEMDRMRQMIAERMVNSKHTSPHVTSFVEADVTTIVEWRNKMKNQFQKATGESLTFTPFFIEAVAKAIKDFPMINVQVNGTKIIRKKDINIGMAVALPSGNLIVPVLKNADNYTLKGLAQLVNDLATRARNNKLKPDELSNGTYTVTNVGSFGNVMGTPIIMQPQVAILALGAIQKKPAVIETPSGDAIAIRHKLFLSHSYDHRVVDGALGGSFVRRVADYLEQFDTKQEI